MSSDSIKPIHLSKWMEKTYDQRIKFKGKLLGWSARRFDLLIISMKGGKPNFTLGQGKKTVRQGDSVSGPYGQLSEYVRKLMVRSKKNKLTEWLDYTQSKLYLVRSSGNWSIRIIPNKTASEMNTKLINVDDERVPSISCVSSDCLWHEVDADGNVNLRVIRSEVRKREIEKSAHLRTRVSPDELQRELAKHNKTCRENPNRYCHDHVSLNFVTPLDWESAMYLFTFIPERVDVIKLSQDVHMSFLIRWLTGDIANKTIDLASPLGGHERVLVSRIFELSLWDLAKHGVLELDSKLVGKFNSMLTDNSMLKANLKYLLFGEPVKGKHAILTAITEMNRRLNILKSSDTLMRDIEAGKLVRSHVEYLSLPRGKNENEEQFNIRCDKLRMLIEDESYSYGLTDSLRLLLPLKDLEEKISQSDGTDLGNILVCEWLLGRLSVGSDETNVVLISKTLMFLSVLNYKSVILYTFSERISAIYRASESNILLYTNAQNEALRALRSSLMPFATRKELHRLKDLMSKLLGTKNSKQDVRDNIWRLKGEIGEFISVRYLHLKDRTIRDYVAEEDKLTIFETIEKHFQRIRTSKLSDKSWNEIVERFLAGTNLISRRKYDSYQLCQMVDDQDWRSRGLGLKLIEVKWLSNLGTEKNFEAKARASREADMVKIRDAMGEVEGLVRYSVDVHIFSDAEMIDMATDLDNRYRMEDGQHRTMVECMLRLIRTMNEQLEGGIGIDDELNIKPKYVSDFKDVNAIEIAAHQISEYSREVYPGGLHSSIMGTAALMGGHLPTFTEEQLESLIPHILKSSEARTQFLRDSSEEQFSKFISKLNVSLDEIKPRIVERKGSSYVDDVRHLKGHMVADFLKDLSDVHNNECSCDDHDENINLSRLMVELIRLNTTAGDQKAGSAQDKAKNQMVSTMLSTIMTGRCHFVSRTGKVVLSKSNAGQKYESEFKSAFLELTKDMNLWTDDLERTFGEDSKPLFSRDKNDLKEANENLKKVLRSLQQFKGTRTENYDIVLKVVQVLKFVAMGRKMCDTHVLIWSESEFEAIGGALERHRKHLEEKDRVKQQTGPSKLTSYDEVYVIRTDDGQLLDDLNDFQVNSTDLCDYIYDKIKEMEPPKGVQDKSVKLSYGYVRNVLKLFLNNKASKLMLIEACIYINLERIHSSSKGYYYKSMGPRYALVKYNYTDDNNNVIVGIYDKLQKRIVAKDRIPTKSIAAKNQTLSLVIYLIAKSFEMCGYTQYLDKSEKDLDEYILEMNRRVGDDLSLLNGLINQLDTFYKARDWPAVTAHVRGIQEKLFEGGQTINMRFIVLWITNIVGPALMENSSALNESIQMMRYVNLNAVSEKFNMEEFASKLVRIVRGPASQAFYRILMCSYVTTLENCSRRDPQFMMSNEFSETRFSVEDYTQCVDPFNAFSPIFSDSHFITSLFYVQLYEKEGGDKRDNINAFNNFAEKSINWRYELTDVLNSFCYDCTNKLNEKPPDPATLKDFYCKTKAKVIQEGKVLEDRQFESRRSDMCAEQHQDAYETESFLKIDCRACKNSWVRLECLIGCIIVRRSDRRNSPYSFYNMVKSKLEEVGKKKAKYSYSCIEVVNQIGHQGKISLSQVDIDACIERAGIPSLQISNLSKTSNVKVSFDSNKDPVDLFAAIDKERLDKDTLKAVKCLKSLGIKQRGDRTVEQMDADMKKLHDYLTIERRLDIADADRICTDVRTRLSTKNEADWADTNSFTDMCAGNVSCIQNVMKRVLSNIRDCRTGGKKNFSILKDLRKLTTKKMMAGLSPVAAKLLSNRIDQTVNNFNRGTYEEEMLAIGRVRSELTEKSVYRFGEINVDLKEGKFVVASDDREWLDTTLEELEVRCENIIDYVESVNGTTQGSPNIVVTSFREELKNMTDKLVDDFNDYLVLTVVGLCTKAAAYCPNLFIEASVARGMFDCDPRADPEKFGLPDLSSSEIVALNMMLYDKALANLIKGGGEYKSKVLENLMTTLEQDKMKIALMRLCTYAMTCDTGHFQGFFKKNKSKLLNHVSDKVITVYAKAACERVNTSQLEWCLDIMQDNDRVFEATIASKVQVGGVRDLGVLGMHSKVVQSTCEAITSSYLGMSENDMMMNTSRKATAQKHAGDNYERVQTGELSSATSGMLDNQAWGPKNRGWEMFLATEGVTCKSKLAHSTTSWFALQLCRKRIHIGDDVVRGLRNAMRNLKMYFKSCNSHEDGRKYHAAKDGVKLDCEGLIANGLSSTMAFLIDQVLCFGRTYFISPAHMIQGIPHKLSSLYHCGFLAFLKRLYAIQQRLKDEEMAHDIRGVRENGHTIQAGCSSDDSIVNFATKATVACHDTEDYSLSEEMTRDFWEMYNALGIQYNISNSAKSHISRKMSEVYSAFSRPGTKLTPSIKIETAIITMNHSTSMFGENNSIIDMASNAVQEGSSLFMANVAITARKIRMIPFNAQGIALKDLKENIPMSVFAHHQFRNPIVDPITYVSFIDTLSSYSLMISEMGYHIFKAIKSKMLDNRDLTISERIWLGVLMDSHSDGVESATMTAGNSSITSPLSNPYKVTYPRTQVDKVKDLAETMRQKLSRRTDLGSIVKYLCGKQRKAEDEQSAYEKFLQAFESRSIISTFAGFSNNNRKLMCSMMRTGKKLMVDLRFIQAPVHDVGHWKCASLLEIPKWKKVKLTDDVRDAVFKEIDDYCDIMESQGIHKLRHMDIIKNMIGTMSTHWVKVPSDARLTEHTLSTNDRGSLLHTDAYAVAAACIDSLVASKFTGVPESKLIESAIMLTTVSKKLKTLMESIKTTGHCNDDQMKELMKICARCSVQMAGTVRVVIPMTQVSDKWSTYIETRLVIGYWFSVVSCEGEMVNLTSDKFMSKVTQIATMMNRCPTSCFDRDKLPDIIGSHWFKDSVQSSMLSANMRNASAKDVKMIRNISEFMNTPANALMKANCIVESTTLRNGWCDRVTLQKHSGDPSEYGLTILCIDGVYTIETQKEEPNAVCTMLEDWLSFNIRNQRGRRPRLFHEMSLQSAYNPVFSVFAQGTSCITAQRPGYLKIPVQHEPVSQAMIRHIESDETIATKSVKVGESGSLWFGLNLGTDIVIGEKTELLLDALNRNLDVNIDRRAGIRFQKLFMIPEDDMIGLPVMFEFCKRVVPTESFKAMNFFTKRQLHEERMGLSDVVICGDIYRTSMNVKLKNGKAILQADAKLTNNSIDQSMQAEAFVRAMDAGVCSKETFKLVLPVVWRLYSDLTEEAGGHISDRDLTDIMTVEARKLADCLRSSISCKMSGDISCATEILRNISTNMTVRSIQGTKVGMVSNGEMVSFIDVHSKRRKLKKSAAGRVHDNCSSDFRLVFCTLRDKLRDLNSDTMMVLSSREHDGMYYWGFDIPCVRQSVINVIMTYFVTLNLTLCSNAYAFSCWLLRDVPSLKLNNDMLIRRLVRANSRLKTADDVIEELDEEDDESSHELDSTSPRSSTDIVLYACALKLSSAPEVTEAKFRAVAAVYSGTVQSAIRDVSTYTDKDGGNLTQLVPLIVNFIKKFPEAVDEIRQVCGDSDSEGDSEVMKGVFDRELDLRARERTEREGPGRVEDDGVGDEDDPGGYADEDDATMGDDESQEHACLKLMDFNSDSTDYIYVEQIKGKFYRFGVRQEEVEKLLADGLAAEVGRVAWTNNNLLTSNW